MERSQKRKWRASWDWELFALTLAINWEDPILAKGQVGRTTGLFAHAWLTCPGVVMSREQMQ